MVEGILEGNSFFTILKLQVDKHAQICIRKLLSIVLSRIVSPMRSHMFHVAHFSREHDCLRRAEKSSGQACWYDARKRS